MIYLNGLIFSLDLKNVEIVNHIIKIFVITIFTFYTALKITNVESLSRITKLKISIQILVIAIICGFLRYISKPINSTICLVFLITIIYCRNIKKNITCSIISILISLSINYCCYFLAIIFAYYPNVIFNVKSNLLSLLIILLMYMIFII